MRAVDSPSAGANRASSSQMMPPILRALVSDGNARGGCAAAARILDVGCGTGLSGEALRALGALVLCGGRGAGYELVREVRALELDTLRWRGLPALGRGRSDGACVAQGGGSHAVHYSGRLSARVLMGFPRARGNTHRHRV